MNTIRLATPADSPRLTEIAISAKRHWRYPEEYYETWKNELTITPEYIRNCTVKVIENLEVLGFYSFFHMNEDRMFGEVRMERGLWLDHMFLDEKHIGQGFGTMLFQDLLAEIRSRGGMGFRMFVDPNAAGFYERMGCSFVRESKSSIEDRMIPVYQYVVRDTDGKDSH